MKANDRYPYHTFLMLSGFLVLPCLSGCTEWIGSKSIAHDWETSIVLPEFTVEVRGILDRKAQLIEEIAADERIVAAVRQANVENQSLSEAAILSLDARWQASEGITDFIRPFLTNKCAQALLEFRETNDAFSEILVTDQRGLIVGASNKSSDYLQADEAWWRTSFDEGRGQACTGPIEYDASSRSQAISVYVPILDPDAGSAIGVIKAVCDVTAIKREL